MGDDAPAVRTGLRESLRRLLDLDFDHLLFAHGSPLIGGGKAALREFVGANFDLPAPIHDMWAYRGRPALLSLNDAKAGQKHEKGFLSGRKSRPVTA